MSTQNDLETHVELCALRYKGIEDKFVDVEKRLNRIQTNSEDIKGLIMANRTSNFNAIVTAAGTIVVAMIALVGYLVTKG